VKRNHLATALRKALRKILKSLDDADFTRINKLNIGFTGLIHGPKMAVKFLGHNSQLLDRVSALHHSGQSFAAIARLGANVDASVACPVFADLELALASGPKVGFVGEYNARWLATRAAALLGLRCPAQARTTWREATRVLGVLGKGEDDGIKTLKARGETPLTVLEAAG
ncbi:hypothetical protein AURANDRAFT_69517, partial [Aureococcus anophagefferens]